MLISSSTFNCKLFLVLFLLIISCKSKNKETNDNDKLDTKVEFKQPIFDFGNIAEGEIVTHMFYFKNIGEQNFVIRNIETGCGCTTVEYDKAPIKAGKEGKIEIAFNSSGRYGKQYKEIIIFANIPEKKTTLKIIANVK